MLERGYSKDRRRGNRLRRSRVLGSERIAHGSTAPARNSDTAAATAAPTRTADAGSARNARAVARSARDSKPAARHRRSGAGNDSVAGARITDRVAPHLLE